MAKKAADRHQKRLEKLIEEATVDCYGNPADERQGFVIMAGENIVCPFKAKVLGEEVEVVKFCGPEVGFGLMAVCRYQGKEYKIDINSLEWPKKKPKGFDWIEAYQAWLASVCCSSEESKICRTLSRLEGSLRDRPPCADRHAAACSPAISAQPAGPVDPHFSGLGSCAGCGSFSGRRV